MTRLGGLFSEEMRRLHAAAQIGAGSIFYVHCEFTTPPKDKWIAVLADCQYPLIGLINSRINPFIQDRPHLARLQVPMAESDYSFLHRDSFLNCANIFEGDFSREELEELWTARPDDCWQLTEATKADIIAAVTSAAVLSEAHRTAILRDLSP